MCQLDLICPIWRVWSLKFGREIAALEMPNEDVVVCSLLYILENTFCVSRFLLCAKVAFRNKSCGGGQVVSVLAFHTEDPSSNPAEAYSIFCAICV